MSVNLQKKTQCANLEKNNSLKKKNRPRNMRLRVDAKLK